MPAQRPALRRQSAPEASWNVSLAIAGSARFLTSGHSGLLRGAIWSHLLVISSRMEGGANVASEAIVAGVPLLSSRIGGIIGLLCKDYPGFFPFGDTRALAKLLERAVSDAGFYHELRTWCAKRRPLFAPAREQAAWKKLLAQIRGQ
jgi:glycosyltransferase involved in cell wall biosynthesis